MTEPTRPDIPAVPTVAAEPSGAESPAPRPAKPAAASTRPSSGMSAEAWNEAAAAIPEEWVRAAEGHYSMHGAGLIRNILAGVESLIRAAERERDAETRTACEAQIARLERHLDTLAREHARHALAVSAHKGRADQQESRAVRAEKQLARFARYAEEYDGLAEQAAQGYRNADLVTELRRRIAVLERWRERTEQAEARLATITTWARRGGAVDSTAILAVAAAETPAELAALGTGEEPLSAACAGPGCGETFADSETSEYLFASRERMQRLLYADGWASDPVLCPACQPEGSGRG